MADAILGGDAAACKNPKTHNSLKTTVSSATGARRLPCLIDLPALTPDAQLRIFAIIDQTGCATMADLVAALDQTEAPVGLIVDLATICVLEIDASRFLDGASVVRRAPTHIAQTSPEEPPKAGRNGQLKTEPPPEVFAFMRTGDRYEPSICFSGHSLRVGAAQQLTINGLGMLQIMRAGGWRSMSVVARYIENVDLDVGIAAHDVPFGAWLDLRPFNSATGSRTPVERLRPKYSSAVLNEYVAVGCRGQHGYFTKEQCRYARPFTS